MSWKTRLAVLAAVAALLIPEAAWAGRGGGSMGGRGGFSSGRSFGGGGSRSLSGGSSGGGYRGGYRSYGGGPGFFVCLGGPHVPVGGGGGAGGCGDPSAMGAVVVVLLVVGAFVAFKTMQARRQLKRAGGWNALPSAERDDDGSAAVARLSVAFLATEKGLQTDLEALARSGRAGTAEGDAAVVREVCVLMNRSKDAMARVHFAQETGLSDANARARLEDIGMDLRSRYDEETVRSDEGGVRQKAATQEDGEVAEFVVVSVAVAYRAPAIGGGEITGGPALVDRIRQVGAIGPDRLLGMEVVWDPVSPDEELTSKGMDEHYPELLPL